MSIQGRQVRYHPGLPRGDMIRHRNALQNAIVYQDACRLYRSDVVLEWDLYATSPVFYSISCFCSVNHYCLLLYHKLDSLSFLLGRGAYTGRRKKVLLTVVDNYQLKRLEEAVFTIDTDAFFITGNTFSVIGKGFSRRKFY